MDSRPIAETLNDKSIPLIKRIKIAYLHDNDYWEREDCLTRFQFESLLGAIPDDVEPYKVDKRTSKRGLYGELGEDDLYFFKFEVNIDGIAIPLLMKSFFHVKGSRFGVTIQTARIIKGKTNILKFNREV